MATKRQNEKRRFGIRNKKQVSEGVYQAEVYVAHPESPALTKKVADIIRSQAPSAQEREEIDTIISTSSKE